MKEMDANLDAEIRIWQEKLFNASIRRTRKLRKIAALAGNTANLHCLEISAGDGSISAHLRALGGSWKTAVLSKDAAGSLQYGIPDKIALIEHEKLPYEDGKFDIVIIVDALKGIAAEHDFIRDCHRVLKTEGSVVISEECRRPLDLPALFRKLLGVSPLSRGQKRDGYTNHGLYHILKDGFDVPATDLYSNGLLETACVFSEAMLKVITPDPYWLIRPKAGQEDLYRFRRLHTLARIVHPVLWALSLFEFLPGHKLVIKSRRRPWRPRLQPKLVDGRSIAEAAINTKIGTAAPF